MKLYIIRHGQTDWNVQGKDTGQAGYSVKCSRPQPGSDAGKGNGKTACDCHLLQPPAAGHGDRQGPCREPGVEVIPLPELVEIGYGDWEGRTASDILTKERKLYEEWWQHPATVAPPGGETLNQVDARCKKSLGADKGGR